MKRGWRSYSTQPSKGEYRVFSITERMLRTHAINPLDDQVHQCANIINVMSVSVCLSVWSLRDKHSGHIHGLRVLATVA